jgi:multidrug efflux pump subunit AcrB
VVCVNPEQVEHDRQQPAAGDLQQVIDAAQRELPRGSTIVIRGQVRTMNSSFAGLAAGLVFAVLLVYLLMVVNFQSWLDPFIIPTALPGAVPVRPAHKINVDNSRL